MVNFEKLPVEGASRLSDKEINNLIKKINDPRLLTGDAEFFIIDFGDYKTFVPKRTHIPRVNNDGSVSQIKIVDYLLNILSE